MRTGEHAHSTQKEPRPRFKSRTFSSGNAPMSLQYVLPLLGDFPPESSGISHFSNGPKTTCVYIQVIKPADVVIMMRLKEKVR